MIVADDFIAAAPDHRADISFDLDSCGVQSAVALGLDINSFFHNHYESSVLNVFKSVSQRALLLGVDTDTSFDCQYESKNAFHSLQIKSPTYIRLNRLPHLLHL